MTGQVVFLRSTGEQTLDKRALAKELGVSVRTIENRQREGMPCLEQLDRFGRRRYKLEAVRAWLASGEREKPKDRVSELEERVRRLEERLAG